MQVIQRQHKTNQSAIQEFLPRFKSPLLICFFSIIFVLGLSVYKDYGISWDEETSRNNGLLSYNYMFKGDRSLLTYKDRDYGVAFELPLIIFEKVLKLKDSRDIFHMRHLATFLLFFFSLIVYYFLCESIFNNWIISLLGCIFLVMSPRIFAHSFYNSKDIPFLSFYLISIYTLIKFLDTRRYLHAFLHGIACALMTDIRIIGIIVPALTIILILIDNRQTVKALPRKKTIFSTFVFIITLISGVVCFWPYLWQNPAHNFLQAILNMSNFRWNSAMLYMGEYINPPDLPWHYLPVWMFITTPVLYSILFIFGSTACIKCMVSGSSIFHLNSEERNDLIMLLFFFLPLMAVILLRPVLYDAWRHFFFLYPVFLLLSLKGIHSLYIFAIKRRGQTISHAVLILCTAAVISQLGYTGFFMIKHHPHENLFFNAILTRDMSALKKQFEFDYWGLSYKQALEYILENDSDKTIKIFSPNSMAEINSDILPRSDRTRLIFVTAIEDAKYFTSNFRWHIEEPVSKNKQTEIIYNSYTRKWLKLNFADDKECFSKKIGDAKIVVVYKLF